MPELGPLGSGRGARGNPRPYRDSLSESSMRRDIGGSSCSLVIRVDAAGRRRRRRRSWLRISDRVPALRRLPAVTA